MKTITKSVYAPDNANYLRQTPEPQDSQLLAAVAGSTFHRISLTADGKYEINPAPPKNKRYNGTMLFGIDGKQCYYHVFSEKYVDYQTVYNPLVLLTPFERSGASQGTVTLHLYHLDPVHSLGIEGWLGAA